MHSLENRSAADSSETSIRQKITAEEAKVLADSTYLPDGKPIKNGLTLAQLAASEIGYPSGTEATADHISWWWNIEASHQQLAREISPDLLPALNNIRAGCGLPPL